MNRLGIWKNLVHQSRVVVFCYCAIAGLVELGSQKLDFCNTFQVCTTGSLRGCAASNRISNKFHAAYAGITRLGKRHNTVSCFAVCLHIFNGNHITTLGLLPQDAVAKVHFIDSCFFFLQEIHFGSGSQGQVVSSQTPRIINTCGVANGRVHTHFQSTNICLIIWNNQERTNLGVTVVDICDSANGSFVQLHISNSVITSISKNRV